MKTIKKLSIAALGLVVLFCAIYFSGQLDTLAKLSLADFYKPVTVFLLGAVSAVNVFAPIPPAVLAPIIVDPSFSLFAFLVLLTLGVTIVDFASHFLGSGIHHFSSENRFYKKLCDVLRFAKCGSTTQAFVVFLWALFLPIPNAIPLVIIAAVGCPLRHLIIPILLGNFFQNMLFSFIVFGVFS